MRPRVGDERRVDGQPALTTRARLNACLALSSSALETSIGTRNDMTSSKLLAPADSPAFGATPIRLMSSIAAASVPFYLFGWCYPGEWLPGLPASALMFVAPGLVVSIMAWRAQGRGAMLALWRGTLARGTPSQWPWLAAAVALFPLLAVAAHGTATASAIAAANIRIPLMLVLFALAAIPEELAWTSALLGPLRFRHGQRRAGLILGVFTASWHIVPLAQVHGDIRWILGQFAFIVAYRMLVTDLVVASGGLTLGAVLCHATYNTAWQALARETPGYRPWAMAATCWIAVGLASLWRLRKR